MWPKTISLDNCCVCPFIVYIHGIQIFCKYLVEINCHIAQNSQNQYPDDKWEICDLLIRLLSSLLFYHQTKHIGLYSSTYITDVLSADNEHFKSYKNIINYTMIWQKEEKCDILIVKSAIINFVSKLFWLEHIKGTYPWASHDLTQYFICVAVKLAFPILFTSQQLPVCKLVSILTFLLPYLPG